MRRLGTGSVCPSDGAVEIGGSRKSQISGIRASAQARVPTPLGKLIPYRRFVLDEQIHVNREADRGSARRSGHGPEEILLSRS